MKTLPKGYKLPGGMAGDELQIGLAARGYYTGKIDGWMGNGTFAGCEALLSSTRFATAGGRTRWDSARLVLAAMQALCHEEGIDAGLIDGLWGPQTAYAFEAYGHVVVKALPVDNWRDTAQVVKPTEEQVTKMVWPSQKGVLRYYGAVGQNQGYIKPRWDMVLAWDEKVKVSRITLHEKVCDSAGRVLDRAAGHYSPAELRELGLHLFGGSLNVRKMRGGSAYSMHSWGIAIDFDPIRNQLKWHHDRARLAKADAQTWWRLWAEEGWTSLGITSDYDWMHVQAANV